MLKLGRKKDKIQQLRRSEQRLRTILESEPECVKMVDRNYCLLDMNPAGLEMIEADDLAQVQGVEVTQLVDPNYQDLFREGVDRVFRGESVKQKFEIIGLKGTRRWMEQVSVPLIDPNDPEKVLEMLAVTRDITHHVKALEALERAKQKAEAANVAKSQFLATMSHEIRTPMNGVMGMLQLVLEDELSDKQRERIDVAMSSAEALLQILNDILDYSKIEYDALEITPVSFSPAALLQNVAFLLSAKAREKNLTMDVEIDDRVPASCEGDAARIRQVVINLVSNAIKFTHKGGVRAKFSYETKEQDKGLLRFEVSDTGVGIPKEKKDMLFKRFSQIDGSLTREHDGAGLGLAISKRLIERMGGEIGFDSELGKGSTFWFSMPVARPRESDVDTLHEEPAHAFAASS